MKLKGILFSTMLLIATIDCVAGEADVSDATHVIDYENPLPPLSIRQVKIYTYKPSVDAKLVGRIYARGMATIDRPGPLDVFGALQEATNPTRVTEEDDKRLAMSALINDAASIGANALVVIKSYQARVSENSTERRIEALAYRIPFDTPQGSTNGILKYEPPYNPCNIFFPCTTQGGR